MSDTVKCDKCGGEMEVPLNDSRSLYYRPISKCTIFETFWYCWACRRYSDGHSFYYPDYETNVLKSE